MTLELSILECQALRPLGVVDVRATLSLGRLSTRSRLAAIRYLQEGWIRTTDRSGVGLLLAKLLGNDRVWHLRGARKHRMIWWGHNVGMDEPVELDALRELAQADMTAAQVAGIRRDDAFAGPINTSYTPAFGHRFVVIDPADHVPQILAPYVAAHAYLSAIKPVLEILDSPGEVEVVVKAPKWNGSQRL